MTPVSTEPHTAAEAEIIPAPPVTTPSTAGMTTKVVKGSLWTLAGQVAPLAVSLFTTPFVIRMLGAESYGVLILVGLIPTYLGWADFGMNLASTKFASEAYADGDPKRESRIVRTAALISLCNSLPIALVLFVFSPQIISLFSVPERLHGEASLSLKFTAVTFVLNFLNNIFNTPQLTRLRMDLNTLVNAGFRILGLVATPFAIYFDGVVGAVFVLMVASILTLLGHLFMSGRLVRHLFESTIETPAIRPMLKFGGALVGAALAGLLLGNIEKGVLSAVASVTALAYYTVAFTLANMMTMFSNSMIQSLIPAFSQLQGESSSRHRNELYTRAIRMNLMWVFPTLVFLSIVARQFFTYWAGRDFGDNSILPFYILLAGLIFNIPAYLPYSAIMAAGRTDVFAKLYFIELVPYLGLVALLTYKFGAVGAAGAWSVRMVIDSFLQFYLAKRTAEVSFLGIRPAFVVAVAILFIPFALNLAFHDMKILTILVFVVAMAIYGFLVWAYVLEDEESTWLLNRVRSYVPI